MYQMMIKAIIAFAMILSGFAHAGIVIESTRYLYKEGTREISAQIDNKDEMPYLIKSWVEAAEGKPPAFMVTPPLFRLEMKQKNTVRIFSTGNVNAPTDRESSYFFNIMAIPPSDDTYASSNTIQLAVRHRMRLIYRPKALAELSNNTEAEKIEWRRTGKLLTIKNPTPFFFYFRNVQIGAREYQAQIKFIEPFSSKAITLKDNGNATKVTWKIVNDYGGAGSLYSSILP
jgi:P pilus assembly chaperone PapD